MNDFNTRHNDATAHMNQMNLYQEKFQDVQEFRDQYVAMKKVCDELGPTFRQVQRICQGYSSWKRCDKSNPRAIGKSHLCSFLCKSLIGRSIGGCMNRWRMTCFRKGTIHSQKYCHCLQNTIRMEKLIWQKR